MDLPGTLRESISDLHCRIEGTPYARAILTGSIGPRNYARSLIQFLYVHESLEEQLAAHADMPCYDPQTMARAESLRRDIAWWGGAGEDPVLPQAERLAAAFARWSAPGLVGALYVFEGSRMGSMFLARSLSKALNVPPVPGMGLDYHVDGMAERPMAWRAFRETLASADFSADELEMVVAAAVETMSLLCELYADLPASEVVLELGVSA